MIDGYLYLIDLVRCLLFRDEFLILLLAPLLFFHVFFIVYATVSELRLYYRQNMQIGEGGVVSPGYYTQYVSHVCTADHAAQIRDSLRRQEPIAPEPSLSSRSQRCMK